MATNKVFESSQSEVCDPTEAAIKSNHQAKWLEGAPPKVERGSC